MSGFSFTKDPSPNVPDLPVGDKDVGPEVIKGAVSYEGDPQLAGIKFSFSGEANARIEAFNSLDDKDAEGIIGKPSEDASGFDLTLPPQITLTEESAWLKYRFEAQGKVSAAAEFSLGEAKVDGNKGVVFADYHLHDRDENARLAVVTDIPQLRFAAVADDAFRLGENEALSYQVYGELTASITLNWSDVFTASLNSLSSLLKSGQVLALKISPSASVEFHVGLKDDFRLVFTKGGGARVRVAVLKSKSREIGLKASLGVSVKFADPNAAQEVLTKLVEAVAGKPMSAIDGLLAKASLEDLSDKERAIVDALVERLSLGEAVQTLDDLRKEWESLKKKVAENIERAAKTKVELGFAYEYLRVSTDDTLLLAELDRDTFKQFHSQLMICELRGLTGWLKDNPAAVEKYLRQKTLKRTHAWGFTLGVSEWNLDIAGKDTIERTRIVQENIEGAQRIAYAGLRGYESKWVGDETSWAVDFKAEMKDFAKNKIPTACEFQYGLDFKWTWSEKKLKQKELLAFLDSALIWRIVSADNISEILKTVEANLNQKVEVSLGFTVEDKTLRALLPLIAARNVKQTGQSLTENDRLAAVALAKSMPYMDMYEGRRQPAYREMLYAPLWRFYFENDSLAARDYLSPASKTVEDIARDKHIPDGQGLALRERGMSGAATPAYQDFYTFAGQIFYNGRVGDAYPGIHRNWLQFAGGLTALDAALNPNSCAPYKTVEDVFGRLAKFWSQSLFVRAAGVYLLDLAADNTDETNTKLIKQINRSLTLTFKNGDVLTFAAAL